MKNSFLSKNELQNLEFKSIGENVKISRFAQFYDTKNIEIGDNSRIDDFCIISGKIKIGKYSHISAYCALYGKFKIEIGDFSGLSPRCSIFSAMDDFSGDYLIGPTIPDEFTNIIGGVVKIKKYCQIGAGTILFPNILIEEGAVVGALSLINKDLESWSIYAGIPAKFIKKRNRLLLDMKFNEKDNIKK